MVIFSSLGCLVSGGDCFESVAVRTGLSNTQKDRQGHADESQNRKDPHAEGIPVRIGQTRLREIVRLANQKVQKEKTDLLDESH